MEAPIRMEAGALSGGWEAAAPAREAAAPPALRLAGSALGAVGDAWLGERARRLRRRGLASSAGPRGAAVGVGAAAGGLRASSAAEVLACRAAAARMGRWLVGRWRGATGGAPRRAPRARRGRESRLDAGQRGGRHER